MPIGLGILGGGLLSGIFGLAGAGISSGTALEAAQIQAQAAEKAAQLQFTEFEQIRKALAPWVRSGRIGNAELLQLLTGKGVGGSFLTQSPYRTVGAPLQDLSGSGLRQQFQTSPSYNFELAQGAQAIADAGTGVTGAVGGNTMKALQGYGTGLAGQDFWNWYNAQNQQYWNRYNSITNRQGQVYNMLTGLSQQGLGAATNTGQFGQVAATNAGQDIMAGAAASAGGLVGAGNAVTGGLNNLSNTALLQSLFAGGGAAGGGFNLSQGMGTGFGLPQFGGQGFGLPGLGF